jgi:hypothetical protein
VRPHDLFINRVNNMELQQDLLADQNMTLNKAVTQAVARKTAKRSQGILDKVVVPPDCCARCGNKHQRDWRKDCPAKDFVCSWSSIFNTCPHQILPGMTGPELKLAIKSGATRTCHTIPHRVPLHWKEQVEEGLKRDVKMGITEELPANTPANGCHKMVATSKPGSPKPRRMVDMSALKTASYRLTHPGASPLLEAQSVPADSYKTVTDALQGFHMIPLHEDSREYTDFLTEWGMFRYKRIPIGDHVSMDAYNYRFDKVTVGGENKKRCVDDSLLNSDTLENSFIQTANYLSLMGNNGCDNIVIIMCVCVILFVFIFIVSLIPEV